MIDEVIVRITGDDADLRRALSGADRAIAGLSAKAGGLGGALTIALGTAVGTIGAQAFQAGVAAISNGIGDAISTSMSFESQLLTLQAVAGATDADMARLSQTAKDLGADISIPGASALTAAAAMTELARAGLSVDDTLAASRGTLQLAAAAQVDAATAAQITASALGAFRLEGDQAGRVADVLAASANASASDITEMAYSLRMSSAVAATANQSVEDTVAALSLLSNAGLRGSDAGTSLKTMLLSLVAPSDSAAKLMRRLGISVYDATGKVKPMREIIATLGKALDKLPEKQRLGALTKILGSDAVRAGAILLEAGAEGFDKMAEAIKRQGAAAELAAAKTRGAEGALAAIQNAAETAALAFGEPLLAPLQRAGEALAGLIAREDVSAALSRIGEAAAGAFNALLDSASGIAAWISRQWPAISKTVGAVMAEIGNVIASAQPIFNRIAQTAGKVVAFIAGRLPVVRQVVTAVFGAIAFLARSIFFPVLGTIINAAASVVDWVIAKWPAISKTIDSVIREVGKAIVSAKPVFDEVVKTVNSVIAFIAANWPLVEQTISAGFRVIEGFAGNALSALGGGVGTVLSQIVGGAAGVIGGLLQTVKQIVNWIATNWPLISQTVDSVMANVSGAIASARPFFERIVETANGIFNSIVGAWPLIEQTASTVFGSIAGAIGSVVNWVTANWPAVSQTVDSVMADVSGAIASARPFFERIVEIAGSVVSSVVEHWPQVQQTASSVFGSIEGFVGNAMLALQSSLGTAFAEIGGIATNAFGTLSQAAGEVVGWIIANWPAISQTVGGVMTEIGNAIASARPTIDGIVEAATNFVASIAGHWPQIQEVVSNVFSGVVGFAENILFPALTNIINNAKSVIDWVTQNWPLIQFVISTVLSGVWGVISGILVPILQIARDAFEKVSAFVVENWPLISAAIQVVSNVVQTVAGIIVGAVGGLVAFIGWNLNLMKDDVDAVMGFIRWFVNFIIDNILASVKAFLQMLTGDWEGGFNTLKERSQQIWDAIAGVLRGFVGQMAGIGSDLIRGLASGISGAAGAVVDAARNAISSAISAAKSALGIHSPSRVFASIGVQTIEGFAQGVRSSTSDAGHSVQRAMTSVVNNYALNVAPMQSYATLEQDFALMQRR